MTITYLDAVPLLSQTPDTSFYFSLLSDISVVWCLGLFCITERAGRNVQTAFFFSFFFFFTECLLCEKWNLFSCGIKPYFCHHVRHDRPARFIHVQPRSRPVHKKWLTNQIQSESSFRERRSHKNCNIDRISHAAVRRSHVDRLRGRVLMSLKTGIYFNHNML